MANLFVGDVHGCLEELRILLDKVNFNPANDTLWLTGDLVARGPYSLETLRYLKSLGESVKMVLGNHDLHLLSVYKGISRNKPKDKTTPILLADDVSSLMNWLRQQPIMRIDEKLKIILVHAGIYPKWDKATLEVAAKKVEKILQSDHYSSFLKIMYGNTPDSWAPTLTESEKLRFIANVFTRIRYCFADGRLELNCKSSPHSASAELIPWYLLPRKLSSDYTIIFGHWASLYGETLPAKIYALDSGCCWGGKLSLLHWEEKKIYQQPQIYI